ncbi:MAG: ABC transporter ATP-binding protein [Oscillospiraceae bacterium]|nr:ABC transporter ATP-binding protein [Oscillospiraceae bacterium]
MEENNLLEIKDLSIRYKSAEKKIIDHLSFTIQKGEILCLRGRSGAGKSTVIWAIMGMLEEYDGVCEGGQILYQGIDLLRCSEKEWKKLRWREIALVPQSSMNSFNPVFTIGRTINEMFRYHEETRRWSKQQRQRRMEQLMDMVHLDRNVLSCFPHQLSGGMRQRAAIALAILFHPKILILDEATTGLDILIQADVLGTILELKKQQNMTILFISHDAELAKNFSDRSVEL